MTAKGKKRDEKKAVKLFQQAASMGSAEAQFIVAMYWLARESTRQKKRYALTYLEKASSAKYYPAMFNLGVILMASDKPENKTRGFALLRKSADAGNPQALVRLGDLYSKGQHVRASFQKAKEFWFKAAQAGSDAAKLALLYQYEKLSFEEVKRVNGAFATAGAFSTDIGRIMLGNYYLSKVRRGQSGEYVQYESLYYDDALEAFSLAAKSSIKAIADPAAKIAHELQYGAQAYKGDLKARRRQRKIAFWIGVGVAAVAILSLSGRASSNGTTKKEQYDSCTGINGLGYYGSSWAGAAAFAGCSPY